MTSKPTDDLTKMAGHNLKKQNVDMHSIKPRVAIKWKCNRLPTKSAVVGRKATRVERAPAPPADLADYRARRVR